MYGCVNWCVDVFVVSNSLNSKHGITCVCFLLGVDVMFPLRGGCGVSSLGVGVVFPLRGGCGVSS